MEKPEFSKPFNIDSARAGAPYSCANGSRAEMLRFYASKMVGIHDGAGAEPYAGEWLLDGTYCTPCHGGELDLVMLPLGMIDGEPFFVGDEIEVFNLPDIWERMAAGPQHKMRHEPEIRWPAPAKVYPETAMSNLEINEVFDPLGERMHCYNDTETCRRVANAALRHAIDSGQVVSISEVAAMSAKLDKAEATLEAAGYTDNGGMLWKPPIGVVPAYIRDAERDMAIAEAVRASAVSQFDAAVNCLAFLKATHVAKQIGAIDLSSIIAGVIGHATPKT